MKLTVLYIIKQTHIKLTRLNILITLLSYLHNITIYSTFYVTLIYDSVTRILYPRYLLVVSVWPIFSPNQIAVFWMSILWRQRIYWYMDILRCMDMFLITKILDLAYVHNYMRCLSPNTSDTKLFSVYLFTVFARSLRSLNREDSDKYTLTITKSLLPVRCICLKATMTCVAV